jgi:hypothetical protein
MEQVRKESTESNNTLQQLKKLQIEHNKLSHDYELASKSWTTQEYQLKTQLRNKVQERKFF